MISPIGRVSFHHVLYYIVYTFVSLPCFLIKNTSFAAPSDALFFFFVSYDVVYIIVLITHCIHYLLFIK